jgi:hypothetical protein
MIKSGKEAMSGRNSRIYSATLALLVLALLATSCTSPGRPFTSDSIDQDATFPLGTEICLQPAGDDYTVTPGVFAGQDPLDFPIPRCGYRIYVVGEIHGFFQIGDFTVRYLEQLHRQSGIRDLIVEEPQAYQESANDFVMGDLDQLIPELCLRSDVLHGVRDLNQGLPEGDKIRVHLVDIDWFLRDIYAHLVKIQPQLQFDLPVYSDFEAWPLDHKLEWIDELASRTDGPAMAVDLHTVRQSILFNDLGGINVQYPSIEAKLIREQVIAANIKQVLSDVQDRPVVALYGAGHAQKRPAGYFDFPGGAPWVQQISDSGVDVFSLFVAVMSGEGWWRGHEVRTGLFLDEVIVGGGYPLSLFLDVEEDFQAIYIDLQLPSNHRSQIGGFVDTAELFDGVLLFKQGTPMQHECP